MTTYADSDAVEELVITLITSINGVGTFVGRDSRLRTDLGLRSVGIVRLLTGIEAALSIEFEVEDLTSAALETVASLAAASHRVAARSGLVSD